MKRPITLTILAWFLIIYSALTLVTKVFIVINPEAYKLAQDLSDNLNNQALIPVSFHLQLMHALIGSILIILAGIFILKGHRWSRVLLFVWMVSVLIITFLVTGLSIQFYLKTVITTLLTLLIFNSTSNSYFKG